MEKRAFGATGLIGSPIGWGTMEIGNLETSEAASLLDTALDGGVTWVDTAPCYPDSEALLGRILPGRRHRLLLTTKCGCTGPYSTHPHRFDRPTLLRNLDESLRRLGTDSLDLWQLHMQSSDAFPGGEAGEITQTMQEMRTAGKVRHIGLSFKNGGPEDPLYPAEHGFRSMRRFGTLDPFESVQLVYGALTRTNEEAIEAVARTGKAVIVRGWLKKYSPAYDGLLARAGLVALCEPGEDISAFLIRFGLTVPGISFGLIGTTDREHLRANIEAASRGALSAEVFAQARLRLDTAGIRPAAW